MPILYTACLYNSAVYAYTHRKLELGSIRYCYGGYFISEHMSMSLNSRSFIETCVSATETLNFGIFLSKSLAERLIIILKDAFLKEKNIEILNVLVKNAEVQDIEILDEQVEIIVQNTTNPYLCNEFINSIGDYFDEGSCTAEDLQSEFVIQLCTQFNKILSKSTTKESYDDSSIEEESIVKTRSKHVLFS